MTNTTLSTLINDIASLHADEADFSRFEQMAAAEPVAWEQLARALRDELQMRAAVSDELDSGADAEIARALERQHRRESSPWGALSGWAAAAAVVVMWVFVGRFQPQTPINGEGYVPIMASLSADEALDRYLEAGQIEGRIIAELPALMVESRQTEGGRLEVFYVRQFLEREEVGQVYELASDEHGLPRTVPVDLTTFSSTSSSL